jgi:hypothetical protein
MITPYSIPACLVYILLRLTTSNGTASVASIHFHTANTLQKHIETIQHSMYTQENLSFGYMQPSSS